MSASLASGQVVAFPIPARIILNEGQDKALAEIMAACKPGEQYLLTGYAGSGKTTLMQKIAERLRTLKLSVAMTAPTHKAVAVLARKLREAGIEGVNCTTIHSLLSLTGKPDGDRLKFERKKHAQPIKEDVVVIDEASMVDAALIRHIKRHLQNSFVLFVGDPAQLPPVGETESEAFQVMRRSHLDTIVRQASDNPVLAATHVIRANQGQETMDWSWVMAARAKPFGVYLPGRKADAWMRKCFTSEEFKADPDSFRYLCWTNDRVAEVNKKVRGWIYGDRIPTPFMAGERALVRQPIIRDRMILLNTNEEATVEDIAADTYTHPFASGLGVDAWVGEVPSWRVMLRTDDGIDVEVHMPRDDRAYNRVIARVTD